MMKECFKCGIGEDATALYEVINSEGIVHLCGSCLKGSNVPIIRKPSEIQLRNSLKAPNSYEELTRNRSLPGVSSAIKRTEFLDKQNVRLRDIVDRNFEKKVEKKEKPSELIDNFHWIVMRARRNKKLTRSQVAKSLAESEKALILIEQGFVPEDNFKLIKKLESFLGIRIIKPEVRERLKFHSLNTDNFDRELSKTVTIADLKRLKEKKDLSFRSPERFVGGSLFIEGKSAVLEESSCEMEFEETLNFPKKVEKSSLETKGENVEKRELSPEEIDDLIFGR